MKKRQATLSISMKQKKTEAPTSKYINNQISSGQSLKIKDISSPKCQKEKRTFIFYSFLDDRTIKRG
jgi:flagellar biosynthesis protein FlhB